MDNQYIEYMPVSNTAVLMGVLKPFQVSEPKGFHIKPQAIAGAHFNLLATDLELLDEEVYYKHLTKQPADSISFSINVNKPAIFIPETFLFNITQEDAGKMLHSLERFLDEEKYLNNKLVEAKVLIKQDSAHYSMNGKIPLSIGIDLDSRTRKGIDPIHDFAQILNRALGIEIFLNTQFIWTKVKELPN